MRTRLVAGSLFVFLAVSASWAQPLGTAFTYQGRLKSGGSPANGSFNMDFKLYSVPAGGTLLASQTLLGVSVTDGLFTVQVDFGAGVFDGNQRWLDVTVDGTPLVPRQELTAAPYSQFAPSAANAATLGGQPAAFYQNATNLNAGTIPSARIAGTYSGSLTFSNAANVFTGSGAGLTLLNASNLASGTLAAARLPVPLTLSGTSATHIIRGENASTALGSSGVYGRSTGATGGTYGVFGQSDSPDGLGVTGIATATSGSTNGVYGLSLSTSGYGVFGSATAASGTTYAVYGRNDSISGCGVYGEARAAAGFTTYGGRFETFSTSGRGVFGFSHAASGDTYGVYGESLSTSGIGVFGLAFAATGTTYGVFGQSNSAGGVAVRAYNPGLILSTELAGPNGGVWTDGHMYRQYTASTRSACIPIAYGSVAANGTISGGTGNFTVAHTVTGEYDITITGESYSNSTFAVSITALQNSTPFCGTAADAGTPLRVNMWNVLSGVKADVAFQCTVYTPNPANP